EIGQNMRLALHLDERRAADLLGDLARFVEPRPHIADRPRCHTVEPFIEKGLRSVLLAPDAEILGFVGTTGEAVGGGRRRGGFGPDRGRAGGRRWRDRCDAGGWAGAPQQSLRRLLTQLL